MKILKSSVIAVSFLFLGAGCSSEVSYYPITPPKLLAHTTYTHPTQGFKITPPVAWTIDESKPEEHEVVLKSDHADDATANLNYRAHIEVDSGLFKSGTVEDASAAFQEGLKTGWQKFSVLSETPAANENGLSTKSFVFNAQSESAGEKLAVSGLCKAHLTAEKVMYMVCGYALQTKWNENKALIEASIASFQP